MRHSSFLLFFALLILVVLGCSESSQKETSFVSEKRIILEDSDVELEENRCYFDCDGDGVVSDNCPFTYNPSQENTSEDPLHRDSFGNACDPCPDVEWGIDFDAGLLPCRKDKIQVLKNTREGTWNSPNYTSKLPRKKDVDRDGVPDSQDPVIPAYHQRCIEKN